MILTGRAPDPDRGRPLASRDEPVLPRPRGESLPAPRDSHDGTAATSATTVVLNPYLMFHDGQAREALRFYATVLGGEPGIATFGEAGEVGAGSPLADRVVHGELRTPDGFTIMGADAPADASAGTPPETGRATLGDHVAVSISGDDAERMTQWFAALGEGAEITAPLERQASGDVVGALTDRFGIGWLVTITDPSTS